MGIHLTTAQHSLLEYDSRETYIENVAVNLYPVRTEVGKNC